MALRNSIYGGTDWSFGQHLTREDLKDTFDKISTLVIPPNGFVDDPYRDTTNLTSFYTLDGDANDDWGSNNGTPTDITYSDGILGQAAVFNGTTSQIELANYSGSTQFTIGAWFKTTDTAGTILRIPGADSQKSEITIVSGTQLKYGASTTGGAGSYYEIAVIYHSTPVADGVWHLACIVFDLANRTVYFYLDGSLKGSKRGTYSEVNANANAVLGENLNGTIDEVFVWDKALLGYHIAAVYNNRRSLRPPIS